MGLFFCTFLDSCIGAGAAIYPAAFSTSCLPHPGSALTLSWSQEPTASSALCPGGAADRTLPGAEGRSALDLSRPGSTPWAGASLCSVVPGFLSSVRLYLYVGRGIIYLEGGQSSCCDPKLQCSAADSYSRVNFMFHTWSCSLLMTP